MNHLLDARTQRPRPAGRRAAGPRRRRGRTFRFVALDRLEDRVTPATLAWLGLAAEALGDPNPSAAATRSSDDAGVAIPTAANATPVVSSGLGVRLAAAQTPEISVAISPPEGAAPGTPVTVAVTVTAPGYTPTGTVTVEFVHPNPMPHIGIQGVTVSGDLDGSGSATFTISSGLSPAIYMVSADWSGDDHSPGTGVFVGAYEISSSFGGSPQPGVGVAVLSPGTFSYSQTATITIIVGSGSRPWRDPVSGSYSVFVGPTMVDSGRMTYSKQVRLPTLDVGQHTVHVSFVGDGSSGSGSGSTTVTILRTPTETSLAAAPGPSVFGQGVTFTATVAAAIDDLPPPFGTVAFFAGPTLLGSSAPDAEGRASLTVSDLPVGGHPITARFVESASYVGSTSAAVAHEVGPARVGLIVAPGGADVGLGEVGTFRVVASAIAPGGGVPTGTVEVLLDGRPYDAIVLDADGRGIAEFVAEDMGTFVLSFRYVGGANFSPSDPADVIVNVTRAATETSLVVSPERAVVGRPVTLTATVGAAVADPDRPAPGMVTFFDGDRALGTAELVDGRATLTIGGLPFGPARLRAEYGGSDVFAGSTSAAVPVDVSVVTGDYDGDGEADLALYEYLPDLGTGRFTILLSGGGTRTALIGDATSIPIVGDFDGDGRSDIAVFSRSRDYAAWIIEYSGTGERAEIRFGGGIGMDLPAPADYDGDGITDLATFRPDSDLLPGASHWFILPSGGGPAYSVAFGAGGGMDMAAPADYDGDGKADIATFRASSDLVPGASQWFILPSDGPSAYSVAFGEAGRGDVPLPADYDGDGRADIAAFRSLGDGDRAQWFVLPSDGSPASIVPLGPIGAVGVPGSYGGPGSADLAAFDRALDAWRFRTLDDPEVSTTPFGVENPRAVPVLASLADRMAAGEDPGEPDASSRATLAPPVRDRLPADLAAVRGSGHG